MWPNASGTIDNGSIIADWASGAPSVSTVNYLGTPHTMIAATATFSFTADTPISISFTFNSGTPHSNNLMLWGQIQYTFNDTIYLPNCTAEEVAHSIGYISGTADYNWSDFGGTGQVSFPYPPGSYTVTIDDNSLCTPSPNPVVLNFDVLPWQGISANVTSLTEPTLCPQGALSGEVEIDPVGGSGPVTADWTPLTGTGDEGEDDYNYLLYSAGCFQVHLQDTLECSSLDTLCFSWADTLDFSLDLIHINHIITSQGNVICDGSIEVVVDGSTEDFIFTIDPNEGTYNYGNDTFEGIEVGDFYDVTASIDLPNSVGCSVSDTYEVESNAWSYSSLDLNGDGTIGFADNSILLSELDNCESVCLCVLLADFNNDGCVTYADQIILYAAWNATLTCP